MMAIGDGSSGWVWRTVTTTTTNATSPLYVVAAEEQIRKIVREEIADLPIPFDVPDVPPESE